MPNQFTSDYLFFEIKKFKIFYHEAILNMYLDSTLKNSIEQSINTDLKNLQTHLSHLRFSLNEISSLFFLILNNLI